ncbi:MAG: hypothetical protein M3154_04010, partial [Candidatus Eremiobacteraeota bacterium]|nr:hypothetical protein [Candidatus Eremiobacteraeota bacterium]
AKAVAEALGEFLALVKDVASGPGQWLKNLGSAIVDGIKNHLWREFKAAVKEWFNSKVEAVVGVGKMVFELLKRGGIPFAKIASMVWTAVKAMLPRAIA